jgi:hypothetical protein
VLTSFEDKLKRFVLVDLEIPLGRAVAVALVAVFGQQGLNLGLKLPLPLLGLCFGRVGNQRGKNKGEGEGQRAELHQDTRTVGQELFEAGKQAGGTLDCIKSRL